MPLQKPYNQGFIQQHVEDGRGGLLDVEQVPWVPMPLGAAVGDLVKVVNKEKGWRLQQAVRSGCGEWVG